MRRSVLQKSSAPRRRCRRYSDGVSDNPAESPAENPCRDELATRVLAVAGRDHPGILDEMSHFVADRGGRVCGVRAANLGGWCSALLLVHADDATADKLVGDLPVLCERAGVTATLESVETGDAGGRSKLVLVARGGTAPDAADGAATLRQASNLLRVLNVNIDDVESHAATAGEPFRLRIELDVPADVPQAKLRELVGQLLDGLGAEWELT